ncbi:dihydroorotate dehydrogenase [Thermaerobacter subterraneus]|uniref:Iron-sulfur protein, dihydroorotate dehydrogenase B family n=1 Tax=Thermaerobacter subterraneus DSM 13965 TaxID=867903 RepID=K6P208_9FIRM|nr:dihydroorotate dehydrogenase [Thermaerobacter subterraneus]EKP95095.1 iron-sulfur protein, dihydroorotate dehydrogenase B family [Thermaerobacter subterraneus DSM 13965]
MNRAAEPYPGLQGGGFSPSRVLARVVETRWVAPGVAMTTLAEPALARRVEPLQFVQVLVPAAGWPLPAGSPLPPVPEAEPAGGTSGFAGDTGSSGGTAGDPGGLRVPGPSGHAGETGGPGPGMRPPVATGGTVGRPFLGRPFSVAGTDAEGGRITLVYRVIGPATAALASLPLGAGLVVLGPLGRPAPAGWTAGSRTAGSSAAAAATAAGREPGCGPGAAAPSESRCTPDIGAPAGPRRRPGVVEPAEPRCEPAAPQPADPQPAGPGRTPGTGAPSDPRCGPGAAAPRPLLLVAPGWQVLALRLLAARAQAAGVPVTVASVIEPRPPQPPVPSPSPERPAPVPASDGSDPAAALEAVWNGLSPAAPPLAFWAGSSSCWPGASGGEQAGGGRTSASGRNSEGGRTWLEALRAHPAVAGTAGPGRVVAAGPAPFLRGVQAALGGTAAEGFLVVDAYMPCGYGVCLGCAVPLHGPAGTVRYARACREGRWFPAREVILG